METARSFYYEQVVNADCKYPFKQRYNKKVGVFLALQGNANFCFGRGYYHCLYLKIGIKMVINLAHKKDSRFFGNP